MTDEEYIKHPLDALGNPIVIGGTYGYTQSANGHSSASVGTVTQFTPKGLVSLRLISKRKALYNHLPRPCSFGKSTTVKAIHLFPVEL